MLPIIYLLAVALIVALTVGRLLRETRFVVTFAIALAGAVGGMFSGTAVGLLGDVVTGTGTPSVVLGAIFAPIGAVVAVLLALFLRGLSPSSGS